MNQFKLIWAYHISDKMTDIKAKKEEKSSSQTISKSDSKTTSNMKEGLFSDLLMPRGLGKIDENIGLNPSLLKSDTTIGTVLIYIPESSKGEGGDTPLGLLDHRGPEDTGSSGELMYRRKEKALVKA